MVKVGEFTLEIVDAESKEPFKEHASADGRTYVEAEPDREYFIRVRSDRGEKSRGVLTYAAIEVDGTKLGYLCPFTTKSDNLGLWSVTNGVSSFTALRFVLQRTRAVAVSAAPAAAGSVSSGPPIGSIVANFYECTKAEGTFVQTDRDMASSFRPNQPATSSGASADPAKKKGFKTEAGSITSSSAATASRPGAKNLVKQRYKSGRKLGGVTVHYCSALGLIHANILPSLPSNQEVEEEENENVPPHVNRRRGRSSERVPPAAAAAAYAAAAPAAARAPSPDRKRIKPDPTTRAGTGGGGIVDLTFDSDSD